MLSQGTIEEKVLKLQEKKTELAMGAMSQRSAAELQAKRLGDIKLLLDM
jgi:SNF2 family DNA or RNA helicase